MLEKNKKEIMTLGGYDYYLVVLFLIMVSIGLVMVASASISNAEEVFNNPFYYFFNQGLSVFLGLIFLLLFLKIPTSYLQTSSRVLLFTSIALLVFTLIPGVGKEVNGSTRWIELGGKSFQAAEFVKFFIVTYFAGYLVNFRESVQSELKGFLKPILILSLISLLLLKQPDYGSCAVLSITILGMLFLAGVPLWRFILWLPLFAITLFSLIIFSPYRMERLISFLDPWQDCNNIGYQLCQALIGFGRGDWAGVGLGSGIQKLFYLPENHTDFIFSVLAEELGLIGAISIILLYFFLVWRTFSIGRIAESAKNYFSAYLAYGIGLIIGIQAYINIGVNMGALPTKGLTLPFISYGANSMIVYCILFGVLMRIEYENRHTVRTTNRKSVPAYAE